MDDKSRARARVHIEAVVRSLARGLAITAVITVVLWVIAMVVVAQRGATMSRTEVLLWAGIASAPFFGFLGWSVWTHGGLRQGRTPDGGQRRFPE